MKAAVFWLAIVSFAGPGFLSNAPAQEPVDAPISECERARRDWAANYPPTPPENGNSRPAYLDRATETARLRFDMNCDHRLSFEEYLPMAWEGWSWKDANADGAVTQGEYVTHWCTRRLRGLDAATRAVCERESASEYRYVAGSRRVEGIDQQGYRRAAYRLFSRADRNRDGYLTRPRDPENAYE